ncbi:MAG TPA: VOC family protein [Gemmatimonadaceae bacterium]|nr:VOC family protein [Gemmatimonadaceae bacterium]
MKPRISLLTLGVDDLQRAVRFYRDGLGFETEGIVGTEFDHGQADPNPTDLTIGHNVSSKEEVDAVMRQASAAGAAIVKAAHETFWGGYAAYFQDPDGHIWEVAYNPKWEG